MELSRLVLRPSSNNFSMVLVRTMLAAASEIEVAQIYEDFVFMLRLVATIISSHTSLMAMPERFIWI